MTKAWKKKMAMLCAAAMTLGSVPAPSLTAYALERPEPTPVKVFVDDKDEGVTCVGFGGEGSESGNISGNADYYCETGYWANGKTRPNGTTTSYNFEGTGIEVIGNRQFNCSVISVTITDTVTDTIVYQGGYNTAYSTAAENKKLNRVNLLEASKADISEMEKIGENPTGLPYGNYRVDIDWRQSKVEFDGFFVLKGSLEQADAYNALVQALQNAKEIASKGALYTAESLNSLKEAITNAEEALKSEGDAQKLTEWTENLNAAGEEMVEVELSEVNQLVMAEKAWANSQQLPAIDNDGPASYAFNGNTGNWWHCRWDGDPEEGDVPNNTVPVYIQTGFGEEVNLSYLTYVGRSNDNNIKEYNLYIADLDDPGSAPAEEDWELIHNGVLAKGVAVQKITLAERVKATHFRLEAVSSQGPKNYVVASDIHVYKEKKQDECVVKANASEGGTASVDVPSVLNGGTAVFTAAPNRFYTFAGWYDNPEGEGTALSAELEYTAENIQSDLTLYAKFMAVIQKVDMAVLERNAYANSKQDPPGYNNDGPASWAFNGNEGNWWHSRYQGELSADEVEMDTLPVFIQSAFERELMISMLTYASRTGNGKNRIKDYELYAADVTDQSEVADEDFVLVKTGTLEDTQNRQEIQLDAPVKATHFRLKALNVYDTDTHASAREICVYEKVRFSMEAAAGEHGKASVSAKWITGSEEAVFTAVPDEGYALAGWYTTPEFSEAPVSLEPSYTITGAENDTVLYAKFTVDKKEL